MWNALQDRYADEVSLLGIVRHDLSGPDEAAERARVLGARMPCWFDSTAERAASESWGIDGLPTIVILDAAGAVVRTYDWLEIANRPSPSGGLGETLPLDEIRAHLRAEVESDLIRVLGSG